MGKFTGKTVIITGASSGIGAATAIAFAKEGANLSICGRDQERLNQTATLCENAGVKVIKLIGDVTNVEFLESVVTETVKKFTTIDVLINNAGRSQGPKTILDIELDHYEDIFKLNLRAPVFLSKFAYPHLKETKGCIVNVSSIYGVQVNPLCTEYSMTKCALDHFTRCFAAECLPFGVRVNSINPGAARTPIIDKLEKEVRDWVIKAHPLGLIEPDAIAEGILYLSSSPNVTGTCLIIDSGHSYGMKGT